MKKAGTSGLRYLMMGMVVGFFALICVAVTPASAQDADALVKQADTILREAERDMFGGKKEDADQKLKEAAKLIEQLKSLDLSAAKLRTVETKYTRARQNLDRRMGQESTAAPPASKPVAPKASAPAGQSGSSEDRRQQALADRALKQGVRDVDYALKKCTDLMSRDESQFGVVTPPEQLVAKATGYLQEAGQYLEKVEAKYAGKLPSPNPAFSEARAKIAEMTAQVDTWSRKLKADAAAGAASAADAEQTQQASLAKAQADAESMRALYSRYYQKLESMTGNSLVHGLTLDDVRGAIAKIETAERLLPDVSPELGRLADLYGTDSMDISNALLEKGYKEASDAGGKLALLIEAVSKIGATRKASAASVASNAETLLGAFSGQLTDARIKRMNDVRDLLVEGRKLDPANTKMQEMGGEIDNQILEAASKMSKEIDAKTWAGNVKDFSGPGKAPDLAAKALDYFRNDKDWGKNPKRKVEVLDVCVRGPWQVAERDVFGRVIRWRLPIHVAVTDEELRPRKIARVYELSIVAMQGAADKAPKAPPYDGYWVGNNWMMRLNKF